MYTFILSDLVQIKNLTALKTNQYTLSMILNIANTGTNRHRKYIQNTATLYASIDIQINVPRRVDDNRELT